VTYAITILPTVRKTADHCARGRLCARGWELWNTYQTIADEQWENETAVVSAFRDWDRHTSLCAGRRT